MLDRNRFSLRWKKRSAIEISSNDILIDIFQHPNAKSTISRREKTTKTEQFLNDLKGKRDFLLGIRKEFVFFTLAQTIFHTFHTHNHFWPRRFFFYELIKNATLCLFRRLPAHKISMRPTGELSQRCGYCECIFRIQASKERKNDTPKICCEIDSRW